MSKHVGNGVHVGNAVDSEIQQEILDLSELSVVCADTSSLILLQRIGALTDLKTVVSVVPAPGVNQELQGSTAPGWNATNLPVDDHVLFYAQEHGLPILSEDRHILRRAEKNGLRYYTAILMILLLWVRDVYGGPRCACVLGELVSLANPGRNIQKYYEQLMTEIGKLKGSLLKTPWQPV
jgi:hypothetical protein